MRLIWINIIAIVIAITSLVVERPSIQADFSLPSTLIHTTHLQSDILRNDSHNHQEKTLQIAQDFIPIVIIAYPIDANEPFLHYLPIYKLHRQKEYFLLI